MSQNFNSNHITYDDEQPPQVMIGNDTIINQNEINFSSFLPKDNNNTMLNAINDMPIIEEVLSQNENFKLIINNRILGLKMIESLWSKGKRKEAIQSTQSCKDLGLLNDIISFFLIQSDIKYLNLKIEQAIDLFPFILKLASSKYEIYTHNAVNSSWVLLKAFSDAIINNKNSPSKAKGESKRDNETAFIHFYQQMRILPNISNLLTGVKKIEGLEIDKYAKDIEEFIRKCS